VYSFESGTDDEARVELDAALDSLGDSATRHGVSALQMVAKSADGPAPTSVAVDEFPGGGAALAEDAIVVAVIDTGIDANNERGDGWLNEVDRDNNVNDDDYNIDKLDVFQNLGRLDFGAGHGTFAAGIVRQVDPEARIVVYRALESDGLGTEEAVACAMIRAADDHVHVISLSLGMPAVNGVVPTALKAAVDYIHSLDNPPVIVASAGNNGTEEPLYPAALDWVVAVAALQAADPVTGRSPGGAEWSSHGAWVTCSAVGEGIVSTFVKGVEDVFVEGDEEPDFSDCDVYPEDAWAVWSGTSFAAPQIAAYIAWKCRKDRLDPQAAVDALFPTTNRPSDGYGTQVVLLEGTPPRP
jgi:hypothetical protein